MTKGQIDSHSLVRCPQPKTMMPSAGQRHSVRLNDWQTVTEKLTSQENQGTTLTVLEPYLEAQLSTIEPASKKKALIVAAIDFGTTYSGYAYSFTDEYKKDPTKIHMNIKWHTGDYVSQKTKTSILFNSDGSFNSFGYEAEAKFSELTDDNEHRDYIFFEQFKMKLFKRENRRKFRSDMKLEDGRGHQMEALKVFSESIKFMINHFKTSCRVQHLNLRDNDVHWVLTIPAIWSDEAKQFMRKAAQMAGIPDDLLTLAYEPEAAALCCKEMVVQRSQGLENCNLESFSVGQKFIVLDCGGGTIDITCYEVLEGWSLKELEKPIGGPWGGTVIDNEFMKILKKIIGNDKWQNFIDKNAEDALEIKQTFEAKKKDVTRDVTIAFPSSVRNDLQSSLKGSIYSPNVRSVKEKLRFKKDFIVSLFETTILEIINLLNLLLAKPNIKDINSILMVGGFSQCDLLYQRVKHNFPLKNVICPPEAVSAIVKGAVMFGHNPLLIRERKCPRTYGISTNVPFNASIHPIRLKTCNDRGEEKCSDVFNPLVKIGESLTVGKTVRYIECHPSNSYDSEATIEVYASTSDNPMFTIDENVRSVGTLRVTMPDISCSKNRIIVIQMEFGLTEIVVSAFDKETRNGKKTCFKCI